MNTDKQKRNLRRLRAIANAALVLLCLCGGVVAQGKVNSSKSIYKLRVAGEPGRSITVFRSGKELIIRLAGFDGAAEFKANGGGTETCRTTISHDDGSSKVVLSLAVPMPNTPCQMTPGTVTLEGGKFGTSSGEKEVEKVSGEDIQLRKAVEARFGQVVRKPAGDE